MEIMNKKDLAQAIKDTVLLTGDFLLRSGEKSTQYFDKYLFESSPALLRNIVHYMKDIIPSDAEVLAGLEMGGIPIAVALSLETGIPVVFVRKKAKEYGTRKITEGCSIQDKKVCVVEDVVTTGGQVVSSVQAMRKEGALIDHVICAIHRSKKIDKIHQASLSLSPLFSWKVS